MQILRLPSRSKQGDELTSKAHSLAPVCPYCAARNAKKQPCRQPGGLAASLADDLSHIALFEVTGLDFRPMISLKRVPTHKPHLASRVNANRVRVMSVFGIESFGFRLRAGNEDVIICGIKSIDEMEMK